MIVRLSLPARQDVLQLIRQAVLEGQAVTRIQQLADAAASTATMPRRFPVVGWSGMTRLHKSKSPPYVIIFEIRATEVFILRIVHHRGDWASLI
ncbi:MAG: type II toxin-antitoxin system RelE/ParE family toxin [Sphingomicrobium sp.]